MGDYAIMRMAKLKGDLSGIGRHIDRASGGQSVAPNNADKDRLNSNVHYDTNGKAYTQEEWATFTEKNHLSKRVDNYIKENYRLDKAIRKDAVKCLEYIFTSDNQKMTEIFESGRGTEWIKENKEFLEEIYGEGRVLDMHLHLDETTPHLEVVVVPITADGRLSAKSFVNGKKDLSTQQTMYAERMEKFGLKRGEKGSSARHIAPKDLNKLKYEHTRN